MESEVAMVERALVALSALGEGVVASRVEVLPPHASPRRYLRVWLEGVDEPRIAMLLPPASREAEERGGVLAARVADEPFVVVQRWLETRGLPVPALLGLDEEQRVLWLEDGGPLDLDLAQQSGGAEAQAILYGQAVGLALDWLSGTREGAPPLVVERSMDAALLRWELEHYREWRLEADLGVTLTQAERSLWEAGVEDIVDRVMALPQVIVHRDFQSHNLMVRPDGGLLLLDFQDALQGPIVYDVVALLRDSYVALPDGLLDACMDAWTEGVVARGLVASGAGQTLREGFWWMTLQRKLKDAGRFVYIDRVRGNPSFLQWIPRSLGYVADAMRRVELREDWRQLLLTVDPGLRDAGS